LTEMMPPQKEVILMTALRQSFQTRDQNYDSSGENADTDESP